MADAAESVAVNWQQDLKAGMPICEGIVATLESQYTDLLRFLSLPESEKAIMMFENKEAWYVKAGKHPVYELFLQFFEYMDFLLASDKFIDVFNENTVMRELYSLMELVYESGDANYMIGNKFFQREAIENTPIWKLVRRLAEMTLVVMGEEGSSMTVSFEEVICL